MSFFEIFYFPFLDSVDDLIEAEYTDSPHMAPEFISQVTILFCFTTEYRSATTIKFSLFDIFFKSHINHLCIP